MTIIDTSRNVCTVIDVFTVAPENQRTLFDTLKQMAEKVNPKLPGYISSSIHTSQDHTTIISYTQWASETNFTNMLNDEEAKRRLQLASEIATVHKQLLCQEIWSNNMI